LAADEEKVQTCAAQSQKNQLQIRFFQYEYEYKLEEEDGGIGEVGRIMQVFRIARIMRIFKLARRSVGLQSIAYTVRTSWKGKNFDNAIIFRKLR
jgi:hypothetical protein